MIEQERAGMRGDPDREASAWLQTLSEADQERRGYLRLAAKGQMSDEELEEALANLEDTRATAERELAAVRGRREALEALQQNRDALLESYAEMTPEALDALTSEERRQVYAMLRLRVDLAADGAMEARGILSENVLVLHQDGCPADGEGFCETGLARPCTIYRRCTGSGRPKLA
jgi:multidrug resistance efflux pump